MTLNVKVIPLVAILSLLMTPCLSQFRDYRKGKLITLKGDTLIGEISYKLEPSSTKIVFYRDDAGIEDGYSIEDVERIIYDHGDLYVARTVSDSTKRRLLLRTIIDGEVGLYRGARFYYVQKGETVYELYDVSELKITRDEKFRIRSKLYLARLGALVKDCPGMDYKSLSNKLGRRRLSAFIGNYARCKSLTINHVRRKPSVSIAVLGGVSMAKMATPLAGSIRSGYSAHSFYGANVGIDRAGAHKLRFLMGLNKYNYDFSGTQHRKLSDGLGKDFREEFYSFTTAVELLEIPIGLQYYFFRTKTGLYATGGGTFGLQSTGKLDIEGFDVTRVANLPVYTPFSIGESKLRGTAFGLWLGLGGERTLTTGLMIYAEARAQTNIGMRFKSDVEHREDTGVSPIADDVGSYKLTIRSAQIFGGIKYVIR